MKNKEKYKVIGLMSGTSLDGLDIAYCQFSKHEGEWSYEICGAETMKYPSDLHDRLKSGTALSGYELTRLDVELARWMGNAVKSFIDKNSFDVGFIASHGHTIFHQPELGITRQIGDGNIIAAINNLPVIYDFRALDVALGGQGAPLVPIGDALLFHDYTYCLNMGGIANISFDRGNERLAFDIAPCNMALNYVANKMGFAFDNGGEIAKAGRVIPDLLYTFDSLDFYTQPFPKSLGYEWVKENILQLIDLHDAPYENIMRTLVEHIVNQIAKVIEKPEDKEKSLLITGGGTFNTFLVEQLRQRLEGKAGVCIPDKAIIDFKEALIFGFLGVLRLRGEVNCLKSVTGASIDNCGGAITGNFYNKVFL